jgi:arginine repressor
MASSHPDDERCESALGAQKIHSELSKPGIDVSQATVSRNIRKKTKPVIRQNSVRA